MNAGERLDELAAALGGARPRLDDLTRARVAARVEAELARAEALPPAPPRSSARPVILAAAGGAAAAAAVIAVALAVIGGGDDGDRATVVAGGAASGEAVAAAAPAAAAAAVIDVAAGDSRRVEVGGAAITVFGPGHFDGGADRAATDAAALVVDRLEGDAPWTLRHGDVEIVATRATFAVDRGTTVRVMVMRGELTLYCDARARQVRAGESVSCAAGDEPARPPAAVTPTPPTADVPGASSPSPLSPPVPPPARRAAAAPARTTPAPAPAPSEAIAGEPPPPPPPPAPAAAEAPPPAGDELPPEPVPSSAVPDLYALAEGAMRRGDHAGARAALQAVVAAGPGSLDAALALLDLARLAHADGDDAAARRYLDRLERHPRRAAVAAPAARLRAQVAGR